MNVDLYRKLFVHRSDVYARQHADGHYEPVREPLSDLAIEEHLEGFDSYGVYVIDPSQRDSDTDDFVPPQTVSYVVFDLDTYDSQALDFLTRAVERLVGPGSLNWTTGNTHRKCLILEDSGGKGYHVWLLLSEPVSAVKVRHWTETIRTQYVTVSRTADETKPWPALEIFPKQDEVAEGAFGNLVKLPFGVHAKTHARAFLVQREGWANSLEDVSPYDVGLIPEPPERPAKRERSDSGAAPFPCISAILSDGCGKGVRDDGMLHFGKYCRAQGLPEHLAADWALEVNESFDPPLSESQVRKCVRSAYNATNDRHGCGAGWLEGFCPGGAGCYAPWNSRPEAGGKPVPSQANNDAWLTPEQRRAKRLEGR